MRRHSGVTAVVAVVAAAGIPSGCGAMTTTSTLTTQVPIPLTTSPASAAPTTSAAPSTPPPPPIAAPTVFTGWGDEILHIPKPAGATAVIATITGNAVAKNFDVRAIDGAQDRLVATRAPYHGSTLLDENGTTTTQLRVHSADSWTITLSDARSAPAFTTGYNGTGDTVLLHQGTGGSSAINATGTGSFIVKIYTAGRSATLVNQTAPWSGLVPLPSGISLIAVRAPGPWTVALAHP
jgi:hypothetical protein